MCSVEAQQAHVRTLLAAGRYEEAAESARELFERCTKAGMQVSHLHLTDSNAASIAPPVCCPGIFLPLLINLMCKSVLSCL